MYTTIAELFNAYSRVYKSKVPIKVSGTRVRKVFIKIYYLGVICKYVIV